MLCSTSGWNNADRRAQNESNDDAVFPVRLNDINHISSRVTTRLWWIESCLNSEKDSLLFRKTKLCSLHLHWTSKNSISRGNNTYFWYLQVLISRCHILAQATTCITLNENTIWSHPNPETDIHTDNQTDRQRRGLRGCLPQVKNKDTNCSSWEIWTALNRFELD